jgi:hypothetical protein
MPGVPTRTIPDEVRRIAEDPAAHDREPAPGSGFERILNDRYCVLLGPVAGFTSIMRLRLAAGEVEQAVEEIRALVSSRGHTKPVWWIGGSATPDDLVARLVALGFEPNEEPGWEPRCTAMALVDEPPPGPADVVARRVETLDEYATAGELAYEAFEADEAERDEWRAIREEQFAAEQRGDSSAVTYLAWVDGRPVASARAVFMDHGALLIGGGTLPTARGRGAYRALVRARWDDAVAAGTPAVVIQAGAMSRPIVARLGFRPVTEIEILRDTRAS